MTSTKQAYTTPVLSRLGVLVAATQGGSGVESELNPNGSINQGSKKVFP